MVGYSQPGGGCSGQFTLTYPTASGNKSESLNNGDKNTVPAIYCPTNGAGGEISLQADSPENITVTRLSDGAVISRLTFIASEVASNTIKAVFLPGTLQSETYRIYSVTTTCQSAKDITVELTIAPSLTITATANGITSTNPTVCPGTPVTIKARGASTGSTYTLVANGTATQSNLTGDFLVYPNASTTYTVSTNTPTCGSTVVSQNITINAINLTLTSNVSNITQGGSVTLTATGGAAGTPYTWYERTNASSNFTLISGETTSTITRAPARTTEYRVSGTTSAGNCPSTVSLIVRVNSAPLPVELISFEAVRNDKVAVLTWTTASEKNSAYFDIERSFDGKSFESVGQRAGAGTTSARTNYQFVDTRLAQTAGTVYYRLRQVDVTGETNYSPVRALQSSATARAIKAEVFPNPFDKTVAVQYYSLGTDAVTLTVRNVLGQTVLTQTASTAEGVQEIKLSDAASLTRGMYYLTIRQGNQQQVVRISRQ
nr:T9SS type A sorting domain-containing protein [Hymenobacter sp. BT770]